MLIKMISCLDLYLSTIHMSLNTTQLLGSYLTKSLTQSKNIRYHKLKDINSKNLKRDFKEHYFPLESLDSMMERYNVSLSETLQNNVPLIKKYVKVKHCLAQ